VADAPISPLGQVRVAITADDMMLLRGWPHAPGHDARSVARAFISALRMAGVTGVYQFSNTAPLQDDARATEVFDRWIQAGHFVGNHTRHHPSLNAMTAAAYVREIEMAETDIGQYIDSSPRRYFRFCGDYWGNSADKRDAVLTALTELRYTPAPVSVFFHDTDWASAYRRLALQDRPDDAEWLRAAYIESAVDNLRIAAANARAVFGRDPVHIWLIHGTSIAADCIERILTRYREAGVVFVPLEEAMDDPMNAAPPPFITSELMFQVEKWGHALGVPMNRPDPEILAAIETLHPMEGEMNADRSAAVSRNVLAHSEIESPSR
jgi:peptidoglycan/xylan/chitin deacetylase (PgdA/CDA1 family)